ncbi:hypothetical protein GCM10023322_14090 [Rugosimonospora acidiphila]|uniref:Immunity protein 8 n=1 Tax=Rugosimonospora acidiphila TaxID=556531 RepID=A0ABP9RM07_9ACTN
MRHELLHHHNPVSDCVLDIWLDFDAGAHDDIDITEYYDYASRPDSGGREYAYSVHFPERDLPRVVQALTRRCGDITPDPDPRTALVSCLRTLIDRGELGVHLGIEGSVRALRAWLDEAGIGHREGRWAWFDSD